LFARRDASHSTADAVAMDDLLTDCKQEETCGPADAVAMNVEEACLGLIHMQETMRWTAEQLNL